MDDPCVKRLLYITWVRSTMEYASQVWSPYKKRNITKLEQVQRRASRIILSNNIEYKDRLIKLHLLPLCMRREIADLIFCFKAIHGQVQIPSDLFAWSVTGRCLRTTDDLKLTVPFARTNICF